MKKNRIIALLLAILMVVGTVPGTVFAQEDTDLCEVCQSEPCVCEGIGDESGEEPDETTSCEICGNNPCTCESTGDEPGTESDEEAAPKCDCNLENGGTHVATCPNYVCPNCGGLGYHDVCPETEEPDTDSGEEPGETTPCKVCENDPCTCEESGKEPSCDFSGDVGKYAQFVEATDTYTVRNGVESSEDLVFYYSDFEDGTVLRITDWYLETETSGLWYQVEFYSGGAVEEYADLWPDDAWILQDYLDENYEYDPSLEFVSITCDICGEEGCTKEHIRCKHCGQYDCTVQHTYCGGCGALDCPTVHIACPICQKLDCGVEHETPEQEDYTPPTTPVIPETPQLPEEYSVVITDEFGVPVTESGFDLGWNEKASLSAWSALGEDVSYQWQIFIDEGEGYWVDITGQTGKGLLFSRAMLISAMDEDGNAWLRCVTELDGEVQASDPVQVTVASENGAAEDAALSPALFSFGRSRLYSMNKAATISLNSVAPIDVGNEDIVYHTVTIEYVYGTKSKFSGQRVALPYIAEVVHGETLPKTIASPNCIGYVPDQASLDLGELLGPVNETKSLRVEYNPAVVSYTVRHYLQNVNDDEYVWIDTTMATGYTEALTSDASANSYVGFTALSHYHEEIAADSSTMIDIYYDRDYYLFSFNQDGGHGVGPIYARYGAKFTIGTPTREGYTFLGWKLNGTGDTITSANMPTEMPAESREYVAQWKANNTASVSVVFWGENPNDEKYSYLITGVANVPTGTEYTYSNGDTVFLICGKDAHTHTNSCLSCGKVEHTQHTESCIICTEESHAHNVTCYSEDGAKYTEQRYERIEGDETNGYIGERYQLTWGGYKGTGEKYIYIGGSWYEYNGSASIGDTVSATCGKEESTHVHSTSCYGCEYHEHTSGCYSCDTEEHTHDNTCNQIGSDLDSKLWTFVRSETVTVAADGSSVVNVYYDRTSFTMTFKEEGNNGATLGTITDKWGADIRSRFETVSKANTFFWSAEQNGGSPWTSFMDVMPSENRTYYADPQSGNTNITATYLAETLNGEYETLYTVSFKGSSSITVSKEEFVDIEGFTFNADKSTKTGSSYNGAKFYYDRQEYAIEFYNPSTQIRKNENVPYESPLDSYYWEPDNTLAPLKYEPGSVKFAGWYLNPECTGTKFDFTTNTMPAGVKNGDTTLILYAKWEPVTYGVSIYYTDGGKPIVLNASVTHNELFPEALRPDVSQLKHPTDETATFIGWFYKDENGTELAFDFETIAVTGDMNIYAKWRSNVMKQVEIQYIFEDDVGNKFHVAETETLMMRLGQTRTFEARTGSSLYAEYRSNYFPTTASHSITIADADIESDDPVKYTFVYKHYGKVPYRVKFTVVELDGTERPAFMTDTNGNPVFVNTNWDSDAYTEYYEEHWTNDKAVVVELFEPDVLADKGWALPDEYLPNALKIQEIIVPSDTDPETNIAANTIEFIYTHTEPVVDPDDPDPDPGPDPDPDPDPPVYRARYLVQHFIESSTVPGEYSLYRYSDEEGLSGKTATASPISVPGYTYSYTETDKNKQTVTSLTAGADGLTDTMDDILSGTIVADDSLELNFYYTVNDYPYQVLYLEDITNRELHMAKTTDSEGNPLFRPFGIEVTENAIEIEGYDIVGATTKTIEIQMEAGSTASVNTIVFYYKLKSAELVISKKVELDPTQAAQNGISQIPAWVYDQEFVFTIYRPEGYPNSVYHYTFKSANGSTEEKVVNAGIQTIVITLKHGESAQFDGLPMGTYTVTETYVPGFKAIVGGTIAQAHNATLAKDDDVARLDFVNRFPFYTGDLVIKKDVIKQAGSDPNATEPYRVTVVLTPDDSAREIDRLITWTNAGGTPGSFTVPKLTGSGDETTFTFEVLVPVDGEVKMEGVPVGSFTVTEVPHGTVGYITDYYKVTYNKALHQNDEVTGTNHVVDGVIHGGHPTAVTFHNTYKKGTLIINKTVTLEYDKDEWQNDTFTFTITGTTELPDGTYAITAGGAASTVTVTDGKLEFTGLISITRTEGAGPWSGSLTFENLPAGYYTVTESAGLGIEKYKASAPIGSLLVNNTNTPTEANFTNEFKRQASDFTITRSDAAFEDQVFIYRVTDEDNTLSIDVTIIGNNSVTIADLPLGNYKVEQLNDWSWRYKDEAKQVTHSSADGTTVTFNKGITATQWLSSITVTAEELANFWKNIFGGT